MTFRVRYVPPLGAPRVSRPLRTREHVSLFLLTYRRYAESKGCVPDYRVERRHAGRWVLVP